MKNLNPSAFEQLLVARLAALQPLLAESGITGHSGPKGALRETYLRDLLLSVIPAKYRVAGGFICDAEGKVSPQLDLILALTEMVPPIGLTADMAFVPLEAALAVVEVKSILKVVHFEQLKSQYESFSCMRPTAIVSGDSIEERPAFNIPIYVFAYENEVGAERLQTELQKIPWLRGVCVYNDQYRLFRPRDNGNLQDSVVTLGKVGSPSGTVCFVRNLLEDLRGGSERERIVAGTLSYHFLGPTDSAMEPYVA